MTSLPHRPTEPPRLIGSDVDGTLVDDDERISARTKNTLASVVADGADFVLATGRPPRWIAPIVDQLGFAPLAVCANGAVIYDSATDRILTANTLDVDTLMWLADCALKAIPGCGLAAERVGRSAHDAASPQFVSAPGYEHAWLNPDNVELSTHEVLSAPAIKLLVRKVGTASADLRAALLPLVGDRAHVTYSTNHGLIELSAPGVTKALGLSWVANRLGRSPAETITFGDMPNDVPMLTWASYGVAMGNAHQDAIGAANETTKNNNDDGVAVVLEHWWG
ncbi:HAD family hydrolase [Hoyosella sp. YIM 151337]|uniref:HAD family hydrolase n=1 Tax=Hoyosella sp. YIM 151337 TaxID=2992742 RepID=UPI002236849D|nr:HAD family hydrolase [Hoyosella sp. YIM 151337]MCW4354632.1 HAD family hydrolase [Hoyosella sp. YIM 151337]